ncbi:MAG: hypothetical protein LC713_07620, partial [Actinobacteria bacterium]|nr:hypothetical protein [Actinomycetota bacterium]
AIAGVALWAAGVGRHRDGAHERHRQGEAVAAPRPRAAAAAAAAAPSPVVAAPSPVVAAPSPVVAAPAKSAARVPARAGTHHADATRALPSGATAPALLDVNATPWAHVRVDGAPRGETPLLGLSLAAGTHTLELSNEPLGVHRELSVTLRPGEHATRVEDLSR